MDRRQLFSLRQGFLPAQGTHPWRGLARMVPHDEAHGRGTALQIQGRDSGGVRHRRHLADHAGLSLLLQGGARLEHLPGAEECRREGRADVLRLLERVVARPVAADRRGLADDCPRNRQSGIERACLSPSGGAKRGPDGENLTGSRHPLRFGATMRRSMSTFDDPFDADRELTRPACVCGQHRSAAEHDHAARALRCEPVAVSEEKRYEGVVASAVMRAVFPQDAARRAFLKSVGAATALAALSQFFPLKTATEAFAEAGTPEKKDLKVGFIPITCATPIIMAAPLGFYAKYGLNVEVVKTAGWAVVRDKTINKEYDAAHMLAPMPIAISLGLGANAIPFTVPAVENINGQAITLAVKHKDKRDPKDWKGFKFAVPFDYSMHNYLLRYYLAEHGLDPDVDVQIRAVPPPEMVANLRADNIDGFLGPDPMNQRAVYDGVGFIHILTKDIWEGHPCCAFAASKEFVTTSPTL